MSVVCEKGIEMKVWQWVLIGVGAGVLFVGWWVMHT